MNHGRLLEVGQPRSVRADRRPVSWRRSWAPPTCCSARSPSRACDLGAATLTPDRVTPLISGGAEAVLVVRPEDIEVSSGNSPPQSRPFAAGVVRALTFAGHQQHVSIELAEQSGIQPATGNGQETGASMTVDALRSAAEQSALPLAVGTRHEPWRAPHTRPAHPDFELSYHGSRWRGERCAGRQCGPDPARAQHAGARDPSRRSGLGRTERLDAGICVLPLRADTPTALRAAVEHGARRILCIPASAPLPLRMLIHAGDAARRSDLLALVSSVMRHLPVETTAVTVQRAEASRSEVLEAQRMLLDTRADLRGGHGLDLRGERFVGDRSAWLAHLATQSEPVLVVMGLPGRMSELSASLPRDHAPLLGRARGPRYCLR